MFKVCETRCDQCLFSAQRIVSKKRMAEIIKDCRQADNYFICHKHDDVMCRGYYDTQSPLFYIPMLIIAAVFLIIAFRGLPWG